MFAPKYCSILQFLWPVHYPNPWTLMQQCVVHALEVEFCGLSCPIGRLCCHTAICEVMCDPLRGSNHLCFLSPSRRKVLQVLESATIRRTRCAVVVAGHRTTSRSTLARSADTQRLVCVRVSFPPEEATAHSRSFERLGSPASAKASTSLGRETQPYGWSDGINPCLCGFNFDLQTRQILRPKPEPL